MTGKIVSTLNWLPFYLGRKVRRSLTGERVRPKQVNLCICDHFEPFWNGAGTDRAKKRVQRWIDCYPPLANKYRDSFGNVLKYSFFYPEEEYRKEELDALAKLCRAGYGEVEIHLHHDNDNAENLRRTLLEYKKRLHGEHGLLSVDAATGEIVYGFIHGNWSLCNSRPDGRWCGVNKELTVLLETGCYADFTMPSAPSPTQTKKVNSIYYAVDKPGRPKSHDWGRNAAVGEEAEGLLIVQGPLALNWGDRKYGFLPRIENSGLLWNTPPSLARLSMWVDAGICVQGAPEHVFVKLYTHGAQDEVIRMLFDQGGFARLFESIEQYAGTHDVNFSFLSAREMAESVNRIRKGKTPSLSRSRT